mgnify:CR=1 FL=1
MKPGDMVRGKPGCPNVGIVSIVTSKPYILLERFGLDSAFLGPPELHSELLEPSGLDSELLGPPGLDSELLERSGLDSELLVPSWAGFSPPGTL